MHRVLLLALAFAAAPVFAIGQAAPAKPPPKPMERDMAKVCADDAKRFCGGPVSPGAKCLGAHMNELQPACRAKLAQGKRKKRSSR